jgi:hypothetical protein
MNDFMMGVFVRMGALNATRDLLGHGGIKIETKKCNKKFMIHHWPL